MNGALSAPFWCLCQKFLYSFFTVIKLLLHKALSDWSCAFHPKVKFFPSEVMNLTLFTVSHQCLTISSSAIPLSFCLSSFPWIGSVPMNWLFESGGQNSATSKTVLPMNVQGWFPLGLTGFISLQSKELSRGFSSTPIQMNQFFSTQLSLWSNSH